MSTRNEILLSAAHQAKDLAAYLVSAPNDYTVIATLREEAEAIGEVAQTLRIRELLVLSKRLVDAAAMDLSSAAGITQLESIVSRILAFAQALARRSKMEWKAELETDVNVPSDPFSDMTGTRWVSL